MPIIPWKPFWDMDKWFEEEEPEEWFEEHPFFSPRRFAREFARPRWGLLRRLEEIPMARTPRMDVYEDNGNVVVEVELPKIDPKNIDIEVKDNILKLEAKTEEKKEEKKKGYYKKEISSGFFKRILPLPVEVVGEKAEADYKDGILKITIPKAKPKKEEKKGVKIKIKGK